MPPLTPAEAWISRQIVRKTARKPIEALPENPDKIQEIVRQLRILHTQCLTEGQNIPFLASNRHKIKPEDMPELLLDVLADLQQQHAELFRKNSGLDAYILGLIEEAKTNEEISRKFEELRQEVAKKHELREAISTLFDGIKENFSDIASVSISLVDDDNILRSVFEDRIAELENRAKQGDKLAKQTLQNTIELEKSIFLRKREYIEQTLLKGKNTRTLQIETPTEAEFHPKTKSAITLAIHDEKGAIIGSLNVSSKNPQKYPQGVDDLFFATFVRDISIALQNAVFHEQNTKDYLTGLYMRRTFEQKAAELMKTSQEEGKPLTAIMLDVDKFKLVNDTFGHNIGDIVLKIIGKALRHEIKTSDLAGRFGGEEFVIFCPNTTEEEAILLARRLGREFSAHFFSLVQKGETAPDGHDFFRVSASFGIKQLTDEQNPNELISASDHHLYASKENGRSRITASNGQIIVIDRPDDGGYFYRKDLPQK